MDAYRIIVIDFTVLLIACVLYAVILSRRKVRAWYRGKNWTWVMLIIGVCLVLIAIGALIPFGIVDLWSFGIFVLAFCVAGIPIGIGESLQSAHDAGLEQGRKKNNDKDSGRSAGV